MSDSTPQTFLVADDANQVAWKREIGQKPFRDAHDPWKAYATTDDMVVEPETGMLTIPKHMDDPTR